jgi:hypothetical protein
MPKKSRGEIFEGVAEGFSGAGVPPDEGPEDGASGAKGVVSSGDVSVVWAGL